MGKRFLTVAKKLRSTFYCLEVITLRRAEGSPRPAIDAIKKASLRSAQDETRSPEARSGAQLTKFLYVFPDTPLPRLNCAPPNTAPKGLGWGNTAAQN